MSEPGRKVSPRGANALALRCPGGVPGDCSAQERRCNHGAGIGAVAGTLRNAHLYAGRERHDQQLTTPSGSSERCRRGGEAPCWVWSARAAGFAWGYPEWGGPINGVSLSGSSPLGNVGPSCRQRTYEDGRHAMPARPSRKGKDVLVLPDVFHEVHAGRLAGGHNRELADPAVSSQGPWALPGDHPSNTVRCNDDSAEEGRGTPGRACLGCRRSTRGGKT